MASICAGLTRVGGDRRQSVVARRTAETGRSSLLASQHGSNAWLEHDADGGTDRHRADRDLVRGRGDYRGAHGISIWLDGTLGANTRASHAAGLTLRCSSQGHVGARPSGALLDALAAELWR